MEGKAVTRWLSGSRLHRVLGCLILLILPAAFFQPTVVMGKSMLPSLSPWNLVWLDRTAYRDAEPQRGEVIIFRKGGATYVKRVYRAAGERIGLLMRAEEVLGVIREAKIDEMRHRSLEQHGVRVSSYRIPPGYVFVLGDNYEQSEDSRHIGLIPVDSILGRVRTEPDVHRAWEVEISPRHARHSAVHGAAAAPQG